jgi:23S rRNA-/tRNA-specific pseudouridylate synthase
LKPETAAPGGWTSCPILHADAHLIAVHKPAGILSHPNPDGKGRAAFHGRYDAKRRVFRSAAGELFLLHRLDQDTSGILLAAFDEASATAVRAAFESGKVKKTYLAWLCGKPRPPAGTWKDHLAVKHLGSRVRAEVLHGREPNALAHYRTTGDAAGGRLSRVEIDLLTGRTHQIRVQAAARRVPVAGDDVYGNFALNKLLRKDCGLRRLALHAWKLQLPHPATAKNLDLTAEPDLPL